MLEFLGFTSVTEFLAYFVIYAVLALGAFFAVLMLISVQRKMLVSELLKVQTTRRIGIGILTNIAVPAIALLLV